jgi:quercetin dioxygenase-like cupin family protein
MIKTVAFTAALLAAAVSPTHADSSLDYAAASAGTRILETPNGVASIRMLIEKSNLPSGEIEIGEFTFSADFTDTRAHPHGALEIFYVIEGRLKHVVNGVEHILEPGMVGVVAKGDTVVHGIVDGEPVRALTLWLPAGEAESLLNVGFVEKPIGE